MNFDTFLIPIVGAIIGWFTNYLAIRMVFNPKKPVRFLFWDIQGIFPKRKEEFAKKLGEVIEKELISHSDIEAACNDREFYKKLSLYVADTTESLFKERLARLHLKIPSPIQEKLFNILHKAVSHEIEKVVPHLTQKALLEIQQRVEIKEVIRKKVNEFPMEKVEEMVFSIMKKELGFVEIVGGILGFLIGCAQVLLLKLLH